MERKYLAEFGLGVYPSYKTLIPVEFLSELEKINDGHKYHIYSILAYQQIYFKKDKTYTSEKGIHITLFEVCDGNEIEYELPIWEIDTNIDYSKVELNSNYPHTSMHVEIKDVEFLKKHPEYIEPLVVIQAQDLFNIFAANLKSVNEYEVLYVGQAYGSRGERTALTRLSSHSTLQKILTDCQSKYADKHIYILLLEMSTKLNMSFDGLTKKYSVSEDKDIAHMNKVLSDLPREQQVINITEAALINYFKPMYNVNFVENFPDIKHRGYKQYFDLDYNCLVVELDLEFDNAPIIQLYTSSNRINSIFDYIRYDLFNDSNRRNMYDIFKDDNIKR